MDGTHHQDQTYSVQPPSLPENANRPNNPSGDLRGAMARSVVSFLQICYGIIEIAFIITFTAVTIKTVSYINFFGIFAMVFGMICAAVMIVAGGFGRRSRQDSCKVIAYMVLNVGSAICGAFCVLFSGFFFVYTILSSHYEEWSLHRRVAGITLSFALLLTFILHMVISIIGASFTCGAVCNTHNSSRRRHEDYNNEHRPIQGQDSQENLIPITPLLPRPNVPPENEVSPSSYGSL